jgi:hypothetical protein
MVESYDTYDHRLCPGAVISLAAQHDTPYPLGHDPEEKYGMKQVIVIGGGVVGLTSAWWLLEAGF